MPRLAFQSTVEPLWKGQESLTKVAKFGPFSCTVLYKSCLFYPSWQATFFEGPPSWVAFIEGFHSIAFHFTFCKLCCEIFCDKLLGYILCVCIIPQCCIFGMKCTRLLSILLYFVTWKSCTLMRNKCYDPEFCVCISRHYFKFFNSLRLSDAFMHQKTNHHWFK